MELKLEQGRYVTDGAGKLQVVTGAEEVAQRVIMRLMTPRGAFGPLPEYGSRLHTLARTAKPGAWQTAAMQYIAEALEDETAVEVTGVEVTRQADDTVRVDVTFRVAGETFSGTVTV